MKIPGLFLILFLYQLPAIPAQFRERSISRRNIPFIDSLNTSVEISEKNNQKFSKYSAPQAFTRPNQIKCTNEQIEAISASAQYYTIQEDHVKTLEYYFQLIDIYDRNQDIENLAVSYSKVIQLFILLKDYGLAEKYLAMMIRELQKSLTPSARAVISLCQAKCFLAKKEYDHAIRSLYVCILCYQKEPDIYLEGIVYKYIGDAYIQKNMLAHAGYNYRIAIACFKRIPNPTEIAVIYTRFAYICLLQNNYQRNLEVNLDAMRIRERSFHSFFKASSYLNVGDAYWLLGNKDSARFYLQKSLDLATQIKRTALLEAINSSLYDYARADKNYPEALKYFMARQECRNKMSYDRNRSEFLIFEINRTIRNSEVRNELLNQEILIQNLTIRNRRIQIFLSEATLIFMLSFIFLVDTLSRKNRKRKNELKDLNARLTQEINIRIEAEGMLTRGEELHRFLAENTIDVISLMDAGMQRIYISPSCERFYGYNTQEILQLDSPLDLVTPSFHVVVNQHLLEMFRSKKSTRYVYKVLRKDGSMFWAEASVNPILDSHTNEVKSLITVVRDISERMKHEEDLSENSRQKEYLLREIHNRVKNNFAILISLMNMQRDQSSNPELSSSLTDLRLRVRTMSLVHEQLYQTREISAIPFDNYLRDLALVISSSFNNNRIRLQTDIVPCKVVIEMALPLGLIINELITNAYKYAFPGDRTGNIWVRLLPENEEKFCVSICDDGVGLPTDFNRNSTNSMGSQIVDILVEQIEANIEVSNNGGACFRILFSTA